MRRLASVALCGALTVAGCGDDPCLPAGPASPSVVEAVETGGPGPFVTSGDEPIPPPDHPPIDTIPHLPMPAVDGSRRPNSSNGPGTAVSVDRAGPVEPVEPGCGVSARPRSRR